MSVRLIPFTEDMCINESPAPVTESDTINLVDKERELNINGPMGDNPFMTSEKNYSRRILEDKVRSYIKLCVPVINTLITDANNNIAINILNLSRKEINEIIKGQIIYDTYEDKLISAREALPGESYLYGGEIVEHIVNNYNTEDEIIKELEKIILDNFYKKKERQCNPITVCKSSDIGNILPEYDLKVNFYSEKVESDIEIINWFKYTYIKNHPVSKLTALLRLKENVLDSLYTRTIRVLPRGMRPMIDGRSDSMTVMYSDLLRIDKVLRRLTDADKDIKQSSRVSQPAIYAAKYRNLQYAFDFLVSCTEIQREERTKSTDKNRKRKSIFQYTSTKQGHIRDDMLKKVQDFSGRSVIVADPDLSVDEVRLPKEMADVVMRYHTKIKPEKNQSLDEVIKHVPIVINRAPTLHRLSLRGYKVKISDNNSIGVNPLSAEGFNFDHDGDTMAVHIPISDEAIREVNELFDVKRNLFIPASGKVTLMPKQELVYGLNIISSSYKNPIQNEDTVEINDDEELIAAFENYDISVYENAKYNSVNKTLGEHLIDFIFPHDIVLLCKDIKKNTMKLIMENLSKKKISVFKKCVDRLVKCAYTAATLYPPCISILDDFSDKDTINKPFEGFEESMAIYRENYQNGYDNKNTYNTLYTEAFDKIAEKVNNNIESDIGVDNGFVQLVTCGARGDTGNLQQMVSYKGRIAKSATEAFNIVITSSYLSNLNSLEQFIAAYGSRKSLIDKIRKPAETGAASRRMAHTAIDASIISEDCGTKEGIEISADKLTKYAEPRSIEDNVVEDMLVYILEGRYEVENDNIITRKMAKTLSSEMMRNRKKSIKIRSPITCKDKYCSKCYGTDLTINRRAVKGLPIGIIAAQSIGEPGTQLSMRTFHKGGVSSKADITSDFDKIKSIIDIVFVSPLNPQYDPIAWETGEVSIVDNGNSYKVIINEDSYRNIKFSNKPFLKKYVKKGENMSIMLGNCNIKEIEEYGGIMEAVEYMIFSIFTIYFSQATVNLKHIETLVSEMIKYVVVGKIIKNGLPIGTVLNCREYMNLEQRSSYEIVPRLFNSVKAPLAGENFLSGLAFSYFKNIYSEAMLMGQEDKLNNAFSRILMGLAPKTGTSVMDFLNDRKKVYEEPIEIY